MLKQDGVSLIELLIGFAVLGIVVAIAIPNLSSWMQNVQVRTAAESLLNGVQIAKGEAIRRNSQAKFSMTSTSGVADWSVIFVQDGSTVQSWKGAQAKNARVGASAAATQNYATALAAGAGMPASVTFNALGHVVNVGTDITRIDVTNAADSTARRLVIVISPFGFVRLCDPALSLASNPQGCA
jgi:type IV fimbrial biogenesis protein FimT